MYTCRICNKQYKTLEEVLNCEQNCFKKQKEKSIKDEIDAEYLKIKNLQEKRDKEIEEMNNLENSLKEKKKKIREMNVEILRHQKNVSDMSLSTLNATPYSINCFKNDKDGSLKDSLQKALDEKDNIFGEYFVDGKEVSKEDFKNAYNRIRSILNKFDY